MIIHTTDYMALRLLSPPICSPPGNSFKAAIAASSQPGPSMMTWPPKRPSIRYCLHIDWITYTLLSKRVIGKILQSDVIRDEVAHQSMDWFTDRPSKVRGRFWRNEILHRRFRGIFRQSWANNLLYNSIVEIDARSKLHVWQLAIDK